MIVSRFRGSKQTVTNRLHIKKYWRSSPKLFVSLGLASVAAVIGLGSFLIPDAHAYGAGAFVMVVKTDNPGTSNSTSFAIPTTGAGYSYNVDCNDDGINEVTARTTAYTCVYGSAGTYTVAITGTFPRIYFNYAGDREKLLEVKQWGAIAWTNMNSAFSGCTNMHITAKDAPDLTGVTDMSFMFWSAASFNENIDHWNVDSVTNMSYMFYLSAAYNQPLENWNTSNVTNARAMFNGAYHFNQPLNAWNTSNMTDISSMFSNAVSFNQPLNNWITSSVTNMDYVFYGASVFNQPINDWNTSAATSMNRMLASAPAFNQPLNSWDTSAVTNMSGMFQDSSLFDQPLNTWNVANVTLMSDMFSSASAFNQPLNNWNTSAVTDMSCLMCNASNFNQPLNNWNTSSVINMSQVLTGARSFNQPLDNWDMSKVTNVHQMFGYSGMSSAMYDQTLAGWATQTLQPNLSLSAEGVTYCNESARSTLTNSPINWTISDGGYCPPTIISPTQLQLVGSANPVIIGQVAANRTLNIKIDDGTIYTTAASADGSFSYQTGIALADGYHTVSIRSTDSQGNPGVWASRAFYTHAGGSLGLNGLIPRPTISWPSVYTSPTGVVWSKTAQSGSSFPARGSFGTASFNGKLWVLGGQGESARLNDVWSSSDGASWTRELTNAPWAARNAHTVTAFNGKLWVMGGQTAGSSTRRNDIWSSSDGINWIREVATAPWAARASHEVVVHGNKMWLIGGADSTDADLRDVWSSSDGVNWTQATGSAGWPSRRGFAATSFGGKLWVMGGVVNDWSAYSNDVWSSPDGITWTEETANAEWPVRASHQVEVMDGKMWLLGGSADSWGSEYSDVWFSTNGKDWSRTTEAADWQARRGHSSAVFNDKLWVLGGRVGRSFTLDNDVWSSSAPGVTYTVCWDTTQGGCAHSAQTTSLNYTVPTDLAKGTWHFKVSATGAGNQPLGNFTSSPYSVPDPAPVTTPLMEKPVTNPVTGQPSTDKITSILTDSKLSVASFYCNDVQGPSVGLISAKSLDAPQANVTLLGGVEFTVGCSEAGKSAEISLTLGRNLGNNAKLRAYKGVGAKLHDITDQVVFTTENVGGVMKTVMTYDLLDGGELDEDGIANGTIVDPIYVGVVDGAGLLADTGMNIWTVVAGGISAVAIGGTLLLRSRRYQTARR